MPTITHVEGSGTGWKAKPSGNPAAKMLPCPLGVNLSISPRPQYPFAINTSPALSTASAKGPKGFGPEAKVLRAPFGVNS